MRNLVNVQSVQDKDKRGWPTYVIVTERVDGVKSTNVIKDPTIQFYATKPELAGKYNYSVPAISMSEVDEYEVKYNTLFREMGNLVKNYDDEEYRRINNFISECYASGKGRSNLRRLHEYRYFHGTDIDISDHYIARYIKKYGDAGDNSINIGANLKKAYWDIEVCSLNYDLFPDPTIAPCPVDAISYYNEVDNTLFAFLLNAVELQNPNIEPFIKDRMDDFIKEKEEEFTAMANKHFKYGKKLKIKIEFFDKELDLLKAFFRQVNSEDVSPDILLAWNQSFDFQTVMNRIKFLGAEPAEIMCPSWFDIKQVYYREDTNAKDLKKKRDRYAITSDVMFSDLMFNYIQLRASMAAKDSYALDAILHDEIGDSKVDLEGISIQDLTYVDYEKFVYYSLKDTFSIFVLDSKIGDTDQLYGISMKTRTRFSKGMTKTTSLRNFAINFYETNGWVLSNNRNSLKKNFGQSNKDAPSTDDDLDEEESFRGAFVADPNMIEDVGIELFGGKSDKVFELVMDEDLKSLYPSIIMAFNIDTTTQLGIARFTDQINDEESIEFFDYLGARNYVALGSKYFNLPSADELADLDL